MALEGGPDQQEGHFELFDFLFHLFFLFFIFYYEMTDITDLDHAFSFHISGEIFSPEMSNFL